MKFLKEVIEIDEDVLIVPVRSDQRKHWVNNRISFFYIYTIQTHQEFIVNLNHNDADISKFPHFNGKKFVYNKKSLDGVEAKVLIWLQNHELEKHSFPKHIYHNFNWVNDIIPVLHLTEYCRNIKDEFVLAYNQFEQWEALTEYDLLQTNLTRIEENGLFTMDGYEYSEYNLYTLTGRPSNHFNNINYAALPKEDDTRKRFVSRFGNEGKLVEIDLKAFHIYLLSKLVKYDWPDPDIYAYFQRYYESGTNSKDVTFRQIYGGIEDKYLHIEFFAKVKKITEQLYEQYKVGTLKSFLFDRNFNIPNLNSLKVLNYLLQSFETEFNTQFISDLNTYLYTRKSKLVLYTYDSFLIDFHQEDSLEELLTVFGNVPYKVRQGSNYRDIC